MVTRPFQATQFNPLNLEGSVKVGRGEVVVISAGICYDLIEFNSGCNERQRLEGKQGK
jgi:hypothetical protein